MPERDGFWLLDQMRQDYPQIAVLMLTGFGDTEAAVECLRRGAADYLLKPPKAVDLVRSIERGLSRRRLEMARREYRTRLEKNVREKTNELQGALRAVETSYQNTLLALVAALDAREHETSDHSQRVVRYTSAIAKALGFHGLELAEIARGALLHDIGKIGVPDNILRKPGKLTAEEFDVIKQHPIIGDRILAPIPQLQKARAVVLGHHERWDGTGYPYGLAGDEIPISARIVTVADAFDAVTETRIYHAGESPVRALEELQRGRGTHFDPKVVDAFFDVLRAAQRVTS